MKSLPEKHGVSKLDYKVQNMSHLQEILYGNEASKALIQAKFQPAHTLWKHFLGGDKNISISKTLKYNRIYSQMHLRECYVLGA